VTSLSVVELHRTGTTLHTGRVVDLPLGSGWDETYVTRAGDVVMIIIIIIIMIIAMKVIVLLMQAQAGSPTARCGPSFKTGSSSSCSFGATVATDPGNL
jgi:hypothetical protein